MNERPFDDTVDPAADPMADNLSPDPLLKEEVTLTDAPPTRPDTGRVTRNEDLPRMEYDPVLTIGERMAAIGECTKTIDALYRRIEEHAAAISVKATVMRGEL